MKLMIMGYGRHGKDTVCELLRDRHGFTFASSSYEAAEYAIYPVLRDLLGYKTLEECYNDRVNHRALWFELIKAFNHRDKARLSGLIFETYDIYAGIRNAEEFHAARRAGLFDYTVWVDASRRLPPETTSSCTVTPGMADYVLDNNGDLDWLQFKVDEMVGRLKARKALDQYEV